MASSTSGKDKCVQKEEIEKKSNPQVNFSRRKDDIIKQAFELSVLTEAEVAAIVFSPGGKVYSFGHPSVEMVADKFLSGNSQPMTNTQQLEQVQRSANVAKTMAKLEEVKEKIEFEKKRGKQLDHVFEQSGKQPVCDGENLWQLIQSFEAMKRVKSDFEREISRRAAQGSGDGSGDDCGNGGGGSGSGLGALGGGLSRVDED